jgi:hypothetical protein
VLDLAGHKLAGLLTLRHPGVPRLLDMLGLPQLGAWLGDGSLGLVTKVTADDQRVTADGFDLSAGWLHATGALALTRGETKLLTGRVMADTLPMSLPDLSVAEPVAVGWLAGWRAQLRLEAERLLGPDGVLLEKARSAVSLSDGVLRLDDISAVAGGGVVAGSVRLDSQAALPGLTVNLSIAGAVLPGPLFGAPLDLTGGRVDGHVALTASGFAPAALLSSLAGDAQMRVRSGTLAGLDLAQAGGDLSEADLQAAFAGGTTAFDRLEATARIARGVATLEGAELSAPTGTIRFAGTFDLPRLGMDLRLAIRPAVPEAPELGLRFSGTMAAPSRVPELAELIPWRAARGL